MSMYGCAVTTCKPIKEVIASLRAGVLRALCGPTCSNRAVELAFCLCYRAHRICPVATRMMAPMETYCFIPFRFPSVLRTTRDLMTQHSDHPNLGGRAHNAFAAKISTHVKRLGGRLIPKACSLMDAACPFMFVMSLCPFGNTLLTKR